MLCTHVLDVQPLLEAYRDLASRSVVLTSVEIYKLFPSPPVTTLLF